MRRFRTFEQFWPHYLREHSHPRTRALHFAGTTFGGLMVLAWIATGSEGYLVASLVGSYGLAWFSHFFVESNQPATFLNPAWSLRADLRMYWKWVTGTLGDELQRAGIREQQALTPDGKMAAKSFARSGGH